jgi:glycosyltransferase involved in cell wall biosynthesis
MIRLSVVIPAYNAGPLLVAAMGSVAAAERDDVEVIVVDDGSTDGSPAAAVAALAAAAPSAPAPIQLLRQENRGPGAARNRGLAAARGEFAAFLDADDIWLPGRAAALLDPGSAESAALARADLIYTDYALRNLATGAVCARAVATLAPPVAPALACHNPICTSTVVARRAVLLAAGGFREDLRFAEDWDLWLRVAERWTIAHVAVAAVEHRERAGSLAGGNRGALHRAGELVLDAALARAPGLYRPVARAARANLELRSGVRALRAGDRGAARCHLARALLGGRLRPTLGLLTRACFGGGTPDPGGGTSDPGMVEA